MLTSVSLVSQLPGICNTASVPRPWLQSLVEAADYAIKAYCKRDLELYRYPGGPVRGGDRGFYSGNNQQDIILRQYPVWNGVAQITAASNGVVLPTDTLHVTSTRGFDPGSGSSSTAPTLQVQTGISSWTTATYTGTTATTFTGCVGGTGTLSSTAGQNAVNMPVVYMDPNGFWGNGPNSFAPPTATSTGTLLVNGVQFSLVMDGSAGSNRGLLRRIGNSGPGGGGAYAGWNQVYGASGKLGSWRVPGWPLGQGNIKVLYSAGYAPDQIPADLTYCANMLVAQMIRIQPSGTNLSSESLGGYSYSTLVDGDNPEMGTLRGMLRDYREISWPGGS